MSALSPRLAAGLSSTFVVLASSTVLFGCSGETTPVSSAAPKAGGKGVLPAQRSKPPAPRGNIALPSLVQSDVLADRAIHVRVSGRPGNTVRLTVSAANAAGRLVRAGSRRMRLRQRKQTVKVPISARARRSLAGCPRRKIVATASISAGGSTRKARASAKLFVHPPQCARFFGPRSVWNTALPSGLPLDPASGSISEEFRRQVGIAAPTINVSRFSTPVYTVSASQKRVSYTLDRTEGFADRVKQKFAGGVPIPQDAQPAAGSDGHMTVWQPSTDTMWEMYKAQRIDGRWHGRWGAVMKGVSRNPGFFPRESSGAYISTTASGLPLVGGLVTLADLKRGRIDHALQIAVPKARRSVKSHPAHITDGAGSGPASIPEGARFRLPAGLDIDALGLPRLTEMLAKAAQRYGIVVVDQAGAVAFRGEDPPPGDTTWEKVLKGSPAYEVVGRFPWKELQLTEMLLHGPGVERKYTLPDGGKTSASPDQRKAPRCYLYGIGCS